MTSASRKTWVTYCLAAVCDLRFKCTWVMQLGYDLNTSKPAYEQFRKTLSMFYSGVSNHGHVKDVHLQKLSNMAELNIFSDSIELPIITNPPRQLIMLLWCNQLLGLYVSHFLSVLGTEFVFALVLHVTFYFRYYRHYRYMRHVFVSSFTVMQHWIVSHTSVYATCQHLCVSVDPRCLFAPLNEVESKGISPPQDFLGFFFHHHWQPENLFSVALSDWRLVNVDKRGR